MQIKELVYQELKLQAQAIQSLAERLDEEALKKTFDLLVACQGKVVVTGIGKTGIIARKISATLASTGTTSIFLHAAEGIHGDLGMLHSGDVVIAVSNSGNSSEMLSIVPFIKFLKTPLIALTGNLNSALAQAADVALDCSVPREYEPLGIVPTSSTTVALALGDALAIALLKHKNFKTEDFAKLHPGGTLGRKLLLRVRDLMHSGEELPIVKETDTMSAAILVISSKKLGCTAVVDSQGLLRGMITDGDLRRQLMEKKNRLLDYKVADCMTAMPKTLAGDLLAVEALNLMENHKITMLPITDAAGYPIGMLHMHDLIQAGVI